MAENQNKISWPAIGNDKAIEFLSRSLDNNKIAQTYVFAGPNDLGKSTISLAFARNILISDEKNHVRDSLGQADFTSINSDLHILEPLEDKKSISIEQVREFIKTLSLSSFLNSYKIGIIKEADRMSEGAKNALLKTLEEPKDKVIIILLVADEENLPKTILSRSQILFFQSVPTAVIYDYLLENYKINRSLAKDLASLSLGRPLKAIRLLEHEDAYQEYTEKTKKVLSLFDVSINEKMKVLDGVFNAKGFSRSAVEEASSIIGIVEGLLRDLLLSSLGQNDRLQHLFLNKEIKELVASMNGSDDLMIKIISGLKAIEESRLYLQSNVSPRLVLEKLIINL